jgi:toxin ParE1/3/4
MLSYQLSIDAESDLDDILQYTFDHFGVDQMIKYNAQLMQCFDEISKAKGLYKEFESNSTNIRFLHCQKHYVFAVKNKGEHFTIIIAIFHEKMDLMNRLRNRLQS